MADRTKPTFKQKRFAKAYVKNNGNATKAALETYNASYEGAKSIGKQNLEKPVVLEEINNISKQLEDKGLSIDYLNERAKETIDKGIGIKATQKEANDMIKFMYKLHNVLPASKSIRASVNVKGISANDPIDKLTESIEKLNKLTSNLLKDFKSTS